jgi:hypothetical protein
MHRTLRTIPVIFTSAVLATLLGGCNRSNSQKSTPVAESATQQPAQPVNDAVTLTGCLRAGEAADTFVLTTSARADGAAPATYHLTGGTGVNLRDQIGNRVEVSGTVKAQQETELHATGPAANKATGTSGSPRVETNTELDIKQLDVSTVKALGDRCDK